MSRARMSSDTLIDRRFSTTMSAHPCVHGLQPTLSSEGIVARSRIEIEADTQRLRQEEEELAREARNLGVEKALRVDECRHLLGLLESGWVRTGEDARDVVRKRLEHLLGS